MIEIAEDTELEVVSPKMSLRRRFKVFSVDADLVNIGNRQI